MSALLLGDKKDLDSELKDLYKRNGILHILSISSLHITIIGMTVYRLLRRIGLPICPAAVGGSVLLLLYGGMTGFSVSACRAIGMYLIRMFGEVAGRIPFRYRGIPFRYRGIPFRYRGGSFRHRGSP